MSRTPIPYILSALAVLGKLGRRAIPAVPIRYIRTL